MLLFIIKFYFKQDPTKHGKISVKIKTACFKDAREIKLEDHYHLICEKYMNARWYKICSALQNISVSHFMNFLPLPTTVTTKDSGVNKKK
jgi:hypothetical protein